MDAYSACSAWECVRVTKEIFFVSHNGVGGDLLSVNKLHDGALSRLDNRERDRLDKLHGLYGDFHFLLMWLEVNNIFSKKKKCLHSLSM